MFRNHLSLSLHYLLAFPVNTKGRGLGQTDSNTCLLDSKNYPVSSKGEKGDPGLQGLQDVVYIPAEH